MNEQKIISTFLLSVLIAVLVFIGLKINPAMTPFEAILYYITAFFLLYCLALKPKELPMLKILQSSIFIVVVGIILRLVFLSYPLSDDVNRYAWEGLVQNSGVNPYLVAPAAMSEEFSKDLLYKGINHPGVPAIYPPVAMLTFRLISFFSYSLETYKIFFIVCDILTLLCLMVLVKQWKLPSRRLMLYAFNPLVLMYGVGEGHLDVMMILYLAVALICFNSSMSAKSKWIPILAFLCLGMAVMTKLLPIVLLPFLVTRKNAKYIWAFFLPALTFLFFISAEMFHGLQVFAGEMAYNGFFVKLFMYAGCNFGARAFALVILIIGLGGIWLICQNRPKERAMIYAYFLTLLCLPCLHTWYLMPLALLMVRWPSRGMLLLMVTAAGGFFVQHHMLVTGQWREFVWLWPVTYLPPLGLLIYDRTKARLPWSPLYCRISSCDIVVPVLNEADHLPSFLLSLEKAIEYCDRNDQFFRSAFRVVFVDGGSSDETRHILERNGIGQVVSSEGGRGNQFAAGVEHGDGDLIIMLHADAKLDDVAISRLLAALELRPDIAWGAMNHRYDEVSWRMKLVELVNYLRYRLLGIAFGDQGIFVRREVLFNAGGMPAIPLMEDVELSQRLLPFRAGGVKSSLTVSSRRWRKISFSRYALQVLAYVSGYLLFRRLGYGIEKTALKLYQKYYERPAS